MNYIDEEICPECHSNNVVSTCMGYFNPPDRNKARCNECSWRGIAEHCKIYPEFKNPKLLEYEKEFKLVDEVPKDATLGSKYRVKGGCKCKRDLMVLTACAVWCSSGAPRSGGPCEFGLVGG